MNSIINDHKAIRKATFAFPADRPQSAEVKRGPVEVQISMVNGAAAAQQAVSDCYSGALAGQINASNARDYAGLYGLLCDRPASEFRGVYMGTPIFELIASAGDNNAVQEG